MNELTFPDFYIVGAPKCGTSALYEFLRQHPDIFLPEKKELIFFGSDLSYPTRLSESDFLAHYADRKDERRAGAAHTAYLQSTKSAGEIKSRRADADILVMLRNPVEMLPSWHSELLYQTIEDIEDFEAALGAEDARRDGRSLSKTVRESSYVESLYYTDVAAFATQLERFYNAFGRAHVHVILHEDLRSDVRASYRGVLEFLSVDPAFTPHFEVVNANKVVRSRMLQRLFFATTARGHHTARRVLPKPIRRKLLAANVRTEPRNEIPDQLRTRLEDLFREDVRRLGILIERDLSHWCDPC